MTDFVAWSENNVVIRLETGSDARLHHFTIVHNAF